MIKKPLSRETYQWLVHFEWKLKITDLSWEMRSFNKPQSNETPPPHSPTHLGVLCSCTPDSRRHASSSPKSQIGTISWLLWIHRQHLICYGRVPNRPWTLSWVLGMTMDGEWHSLNICWHTKTGCVGEGLAVQERRPEFRSLEPILKNQGWPNTPIIPAVGRQRHEHHLTSQAWQPSWIRGSSRFSEGGCLKR